MTSSENFLAGYGITNVIFTKNKNRMKQPNNDCFIRFSVELLGRLELPTSSLPRMRSTT